MVVKKYTVRLGLIYRYDTAHREADAAKSFQALYLKQRVKQGLESIKMLTNGIRDETGESLTQWSRFSTARDCHLTWNSYQLSVSYLNLQSPN